jgi:hypothetical protein
VSFYELDRLIQAFSQVPALVKNGMFERAAVQKTFSRALCPRLLPGQPGRQVLKRAASAAAGGFWPLRPLTHCRKSQQLNKARAERKRAKAAPPSLLLLHNPLPAGPPLCPALSSLTAPVRSPPLHPTVPTPLHATTPTHRPSKHAAHFSSDSPRTAPRKTPCRCSCLATD